MKKLLLILSLFIGADALACTALVVSGKATADGRPMLYKHRDTDELNNRLEWFQGERYNFVALVNSCWERERLAAHPYAAGEAWTGVNSAGFAIMNTASYDLNDGSIPSEFMDREGELMYRALELCQDLKDFEHLLDTLPRPLGIEANFGVIDAHGGAAHYEVDNARWTKYDVNQAPEGYRVITNFTRRGREEDRKGVDRFEKASAIMASGLSSLDHKGIINDISRSGKPIMRSITSAAVVIEGVPSGENPQHAVLWTCLGAPTCVPYFPVLVLEEDHLPAFLKRSQEDERALFCTEALRRKTLMGLEGCTSVCQELEKQWDKDFDAIFFPWRSGSWDNARFSQAYEDFCSMALQLYLNNTL